MRATSKKATKKSSIRKTAAKKRPGVSAARAPALGKRNHAKQVKERLASHVRMSVNAVAYFESDIGRIMVRHTMEHNVVG